MTPADDYEEGGYCTKYCEPNDAEQALYERRGKRADPALTKTSAWVEEVLEVDGPQDADQYGDWVEEII